MPDSNGRFKGIAVPRLPWQERRECMCPKDERGARIGTNARCPEHGWRKTGKYGA